MKRIVLTALVTAAVAATGCGTMQAADCQLQSSANGSYTLKLTQAGAIQGGAGCTTTQTPDIFGDQWIFDPYDNGLIVAFVPRGAGPDNLPSPPDSHSAVYGKGKFTTGFPAADQTCTVAALKNDSGGPMQIDATHSYAATNVVFLNTALYLGTTFKADVTYTNGACSRPYTAQAIVPSVQCGTKEDCDPFAQPFASGINSQYDTDCIKDAWATTLSGDPATGYCFFVGPFPGTGGWKPVQ
jgi:hypothetical protein